MALLHIEPPCTCEGEKLKLTSEQEKNCKVLYRKIDGNLYEFEGLYNPDIADEEYPDGLIALPLRSVDGGAHTFNVGDSVWNVKNSTGDFWEGEVCHNWLAVWKEHFTTENSQKCYVAGSVRPNGKSYCNGSYVGGHMIATETQPKKGDDGKVYIIPICSAHNNYMNNAQMRISAQVSGLVLDRYYCIK